MLDFLIPLLIGAGCFAAGWVAHGWWAGRGAAGEAWADEAEAAPDVVMSKWICPQCHKRRQLPPELDHKVKLCNFCQVRLVREDALRRP